MVDLISKSFCFHLLRIEITGTLQHVIYAAVLGAATLDFLHARQALYQLHPSSRSSQEPRSWLEAVHPPRPSPSPFLHASSLSHVLRSSSELQAHSCLRACVSAVLSASKHGPTTSHGQVLYPSPAQSRATLLQHNEFEICPLRTPVWDTHFFLVLRNLEPGGPSDSSNHRVIPPAPHLCH